MCANVQAWYDPEVTPGSAPLASSHLSDSEEARYDVRARGAEGVVWVLRDEHPVALSIRSLTHGPSIGATFGRGVRPQWHLTQSRPSTGSWIMSSR
jgi:hypothetical protein